MLAMALNLFNQKRLKALLAFGLVMFWASLFNAAIAAESSKPAILQSTMSKGEYLARMGDCSSCHIPSPQHQPYAGGLALSSPLGVIYATNITPDPETGIGKYTLKDFTRALREGIAKDGHHLYPAMPYPSFARLSDEDVKDLYDYFMHEVTPVHFNPPKTELSFPFNQRWAMFFWNEVFVKSGPYRLREDQDAQWNRGAYLVQTLAHCGACHTPRGIAYEEEGYSEESSAYLTGALEDNWFAANLAGDNASGLGRWSEDDIANFLATGHAQHVMAFGNMSMVVENSMQFMSKADISAIAHYVKSIPARGEEALYQEPSAEKSDTKIQALGPTEHPGAGIYMSYCSQCHGANGTGKIPRYPSLAGNPAVLSKDATSLIRLTLEGQKAPQTEGAPAAATMPGFSSKLSDSEVGDVLSYIRSDWGNKAQPVTSRDVTEVREALKK